MSKSKDNLKLNPVQKTMSRGLLADTFSALGLHSRSSSQKVYKSQDLATLKKPANKPTASVEWTFNQSDPSLKHLVEANTVSKSQPNSDSNLKDEEGKKIKTVKSLGKLNILDVFQRRRRSQTTGGIVTASDTNLKQNSPHLSVKDTKAHNLSSYDVYGTSAHSASPGSGSSHQAVGSSIENFTFIKKVGKGGFATVFLVRQKTMGKYFALKAIKKTDVVQMRQEKQIMNERKILGEIKDPFFVELYGTFQDVSYLYMVMEYVAGGDLFTYLRRQKVFI
jgi:hypothetical protein